MGAAPDYVDVPEIDVDGFTRPPDDADEGPPGWRSASRPVRRLTPHRWRPPPLLPHTDSLAAQQALGTLLTLPVTVQEAVKDTLEAVAAALANPGLRASDLPDPAPSDERIATVAVRNTMLVERARQALAEASFDIADAAERHGLSEAEIERMIEAGDLRTFEYQGATLLPRWQFGGKEPLPGLRAVAVAYAGSTLSLSGWIQAPNTHLGGATPIERLRAGEVGQVVAAARALKR